MKSLPVYLTLLALLALVLVSQAGAQSVYLSATPIPSTMTTTQVWMSQPFCVQAWWGPLLCSENKGDELHVGAAYKLDFLPAWIALEGKDTQGNWRLHSIAKTNDQSPGANFVSVTGPTLVTVLNPVTPPPGSSPSPATVTPPLDGVTATPTATGGVATLTPSPPTPTHPIITLTPTPMFPQFPTCTTQILLYQAGDPAQGGLGGKVGSVSWCGSCNSGCGMWMLGLDERTMDGWTADANERVHQLWATATAEAK